MVLRILSALLTLGFLFSATKSYGLSEEARHKAFHRQKAEERAADIEREQGLKEYLHEQALWEEQRKKDAAADRKRKKQMSPVEGGPEYKADRKEKLAEYEEHEALRQKYAKQQKSHEAKDAKERLARESWAMEEYGLDQKRPRFDIAKRTLYGKPLPGTHSGSGGGSAGSGGSPNYGGGSSQSFPEPNYNTEFDGYVPPPPFPDNNGGYFPPPTDGGFVPPPPAYPGAEDYYPPPPPPPPNFDNGGF